MEHRTKFEFAKEIAWGLPAASRPTWLHSFATAAKVAYPPRSLSTICVAIYLGRRRDRLVDMFWSWFSRYINR